MAILEFNRAENDLEYWRVARLAQFEDGDIETSVLLVGRTGNEARPYVQSWELRRIFSTQAVVRRDFGGAGGREIPPALENFG